MNKLIKGAVAGAAGVALLLGGAGTFALWNSDKALGSTGSKINSGSLKFVDASGANPTWNLIHGGAVVKSNITPSNVNIVPGDTLEYTNTIGVLATGDALDATLGVDASGLTSGATGDAADLASHLTTTLKVKKSNGDDVTVTNGSFSLTPSTSEQDFTVTVDITFSDVDNTTAQAATLDLSKLKLALQQQS